MLFFIFGCLNAQNSLKLNEEKLNEFIKKNFKNYQLFEKPIIRKQYKNFILVDFAYAGATGNYSVLIINKNNNFQIAKLKNKEIKNAIFLIASGGAGRYSSYVELDDKLKVFEYSIYGEDNDYCRVEVYSFQKGYFIYDKTLSDIERKNYCKKICEMLSIESKVCKTLEK
ncbi:MAG: hypothetical protein ABIL76_00095 [candidate division WOR-3 bacterium]